MIRINKNLALFTVLVILLSTVFLFITEKFFPLLDHITYYCQSLIKTEITPIPYFLTFLPFGLFFLIFVSSLLKFIAISYKIYGLKQGLKYKEISNKSITKLIHKLNLERKIRVVHAKKPFAFCLGIRNQKIYLSTGLISRLNQKELQAVLYHEQYHLENYDTFSMIFASVAYSLFPFFPLLGDIINKYRVEREIKADTFAVEKIGDSYPLISALKKLLAFPIRSTVSLSAIADEDTLEPRIYSLLHKTYSKKQYRIKHVLITLFSTFVLGSIVIMPVYAKEVHHKEHDVVMLCTNGECMSSCTSKSNLNKLYSEMPSVKNMNRQNSSQIYSPIQN